jgi:APA family basic amino acid/polyamine antiporter
MEAVSLRREIGTAGAVVIGLGSILGTGAYVGLGLASATWGDAVIPAIPLAGLIAALSGISSAALAARYPVAGGTYEFAYEAVGSTAGFTAGWLFLLAKTASAASAAVGVALNLGSDVRVGSVGLVALLTLLVLTGVRRTTVVNAGLVTLSVAGLAWFALRASMGDGAQQATEWSGDGALPAMAFMFVAYTGFGRVATLGEEVEDPARTIPRASSSH